MGSDTMKAIRLHQYGGPKVLQYEDAPVPTLKPGEVLVRAHAVSLNPPDWYLRDGFKSLPPEWRPNVPFPIIPGTDISGLVDSVADDVEQFKAGDAVFGMVRFPSFGESRAYAQYVAAPASDLALKPESVDHARAAAAPMASLTAWQFLIERGHNEPNPLQHALHEPVAIHEGMRVLVNGAAGGVGHLAVQLAKWKGAYVIAVASGKHASYLLDLGADEIIDYTKVAKVEEAVHDVDLVLDTVGGPTSGRFLQTLKRGGALYPVFLASIDEKELERTGTTTSATQVRSSGKQLNEIGQLLETGKLRVTIDSTFKLADAAKAHERASQGHIQGKIVLTVN